MTDNEKRAHDLTLFLLKDVMKLKQEAINQETIANATEEELASGCIETKSSVDAYVEYMEIYKTALNAFNRDFPDGK
ncbi:hypothetical protein [Amedibacillus dolichus]|uniref:Uncharacterized protein n=1 Tax=Amedibacillus dolichus DSM 3991 TaxID=428127 RepID=A8RCU1_9FIRM|nr:hypothetical protein [Amedibacillus dolichus]EDP10903.1 hypothetical protein EUBDOL_01502 [Amedibacillus dolichus DSM 3991]